MRLTDALRPCLPGSGLGCVIALVGAGGKTSALFGLGEELAWTGRDVLLTTTTHIFDPRLEQGRAFDQVVLDEACPGASPWDQVPPRKDRGRRIVFASREAREPGKLRGVEPGRLEGLSRPETFILVEADGARGRSIKAPGPHEPVIPATAGLVLGLAGLDCLGQPMDGASVHRPERFGPVAGCAPGDSIQPEHLAALARSPQGLFKGAPAGCIRVLLLNKADRCGLALEELRARFRTCGPCGADLILVCALGDPDPAKRVLARVELPEGAVIAHPALGGTPTCP
ncbi:MAG TPA: selenium cofactor biosynthesis protein YqeC [Holophaga sp.]|nr:selenium cofactor biosynthesis protein YqeC [Holophaga sp.]HPS68993.1 selenium cofactor biosynthesis protein YqeC [Holophaga sp.]